MHLQVAYLLSLLLYPTVSNYWNSLHQSRVVSNYSETMAKLSKQKKQAEIDRAVEYNSELVNNEGRFTPSDSELDLYKSLLNADSTGMMGYVTIPKIQVKLAIYHTVDESVLQVGAGHLEGSSLPVGGASTHCVLSGHRGLPSAKLFTELDRMKKGDVFYLHVYDRVLAYQVDNIASVKPNDYGLLEIEKGKDLCTLLTCTPYGVNTHRLLVRGHRVENVMDEKNLMADAARVNPLVVAGVIGLILYGIGYIVYRMKRKRARGKKSVNTPSVYFTIPILFKGQTENKTLPSICSFEISPIAALLESIELSRLSPIQNHRESST